MKKVLLIGITMLTLTSACKKKGCTNPQATNYDSSAKKDDGKCVLPIPEPLLKRFTVTVDYAVNATQVDPKCFLDLDAGIAYRVSEANAKASVIDVVYARSSGSTDPYIESLGSYDGSDGYSGPDWTKTTLGINTFSYYNHTDLDYSAYGGITSSEFGSYTKVSQLTSENFATSSIGASVVTTASIGNVYSFRTQQNKRGAYKVLDCQAGSQGYVRLEIIIEP